MSFGNIIAGIFVAAVTVFFGLSMVASIIVLDNEVEVVIVDCYDRDYNVINEVTCTEELYHCSKFEKFFISKCLEVEE